jgi:tRNA uridine 5-carbamoylmethylation protein Kti12
MIIIEGIDKSGKTTLAFELKKKLGLDIKKFGVPDGDPISEYLDEIRTVSRPKIYDRFLYGEYPYSKVKRPNQVFMDTRSFLMLELALLTKPHLVIWAKPSVETIQKNFLRLGDDYVQDLVELMHIYEGYEKIMPTSMCNQIIYDYEDQSNWQEIVDKSSNAMHWSEWGRYNDWKNNGMPGIGTLYPKYLFITDRFSFWNVRQEPLWNADGEYLVTAIINAGIPIKQCHFTHAIGKDVNKITLKQIQDLNPTHVITLGNNAWEVLRFVHDDIENLTKVPDPGWWLRQKNSVEEYEEGLRLSCGIFEPTLAKRHSAPSLED